MREPISIAPAEPPTNIRYWVLGGFCVAAAIAYIQRYAINQLAPGIRAELYLNKEQLGDVMSSFFAAYAIASLPSAYLADRWGSRRALTFYALLWSLATGLMYATWDRESMIVAWGFAGAAQAGLFPCAMIGLRDWLPSTRRAVGSGMLAMFMNVGAALSPLIAAGLHEDLQYSWREVFAWLALPGIVWAACYFSWYRDRPSQHRAVNASERLLIADQVTQVAANAMFEPMPWLRMVTSYRMWLICAQQFLRAAAQVIFGTWFGTLLDESPDIAAEHARWLASVPLLMLIVGSLFGGVIADWLLWRTGSRRISRQWFAVVSLAICAAMLLFATWTDNGYQQVALVALACFFMATGGVGSYTITLDLGGRHVATVFSTMNMFGSIGAACFPKYAGWLADTTGSWNGVLLSMSGIYVAAALCWALLNPTGTLFDETTKAPSAALDE
jgi:MFS transporter, ACS family, D-galactonate transporter